MNGESLRRLFRVAAVTTAAAAVLAAGDGSPSAASQAPAAPSGASGQPQQPGEKSPGGPPRPAFPGMVGAPRVAGRVVAVRANVLQMETPGGKGLTRVILAPDAQVIREETLPIGVLKPGAKVRGAGRQVEGTGMGGIPLKLEVVALRLGSGGVGGPDFLDFDFGGARPLTRGQRAEPLKKQNYSGNITFAAEVKSVSPLVLVDDAGSPLRLVIPDSVRVQQRMQRALKDGDIIAGMHVVAMGEIGSDGLLNARFVTLNADPNTRSAISGIIRSSDAQSITIEPRFSLSDVRIQISPATKIYYQEHLDLDSIHEGDTLAFAGKVIGGTEAAPTRLVVRTIMRVEDQMPNFGSGPVVGQFGGGGSITATVKGRILGFDPLRVRTADGREVVIIVPGQLAFVRYRPMERSALKAGQEAQFIGRSDVGGLVADLILLNAAFAPGLGF